MRGCFRINLPTLEGVILDVVRDNENIKKNHTIGHFAGGQSSPLVPIYDSLLIVTLDPVWAVVSGEKARVRSDGHRRGASGSFIEFADNEVSRIKLDH